jgi:hypothetical protein
MELAYVSLSTWKDELTSSTVTLEAQVLRSHYVRTPALLACSESAARQ